MDPHVLSRHAALCPTCGRSLTSTSHHGVEAFACERCSRFLDFSSMPSRHRAPITVTSSADGRERPRAALVRVVMARLRIDARAVCSSRRGGYVAIIGRAIDSTRTVTETWDVTLSEIEERSIQMDIGRAGEARRSLVFEWEWVDPAHETLSRALCECLSTLWPVPQL